MFGGYWDGRQPPPTAFEPAADGGLPGSGPATSDPTTGGYLTIRGRSKELIISGGMNVYPAEVEDVLATHPRVVEVAVTGTPSDEWGEVVTAWIVADGHPPTLGELVEFASAPWPPTNGRVSSTWWTSCPETPWAR